LIRTPALSRAAFIVVLVAGFLVRIAALPGPGTGDVTVWKVWTYNAARYPIGELYGVGGSPLEWRALTYEGVEAPVVYPPLVLYELGLTGSAYRVWSHHRFPNTTALNAFVKLPSLVAEIGLALLLFFATRPVLGSRTARWSAAAYWLNPAALINASILGYLDAQFALPAVGAIIAAAASWPATAGALLAAAALTKPQGVLIAPAIAWALWAIGGSERRIARLAAAAAGGAIVVAVTVAPLVAAGGLPNMLQAMSRLAHHDMASANACNLWWIVGYLLRAWYSAHDMGVWAAFTAPTRILAIPRMVEIGFPNPRPIGIVLTLAATAWAFWMASRSKVDVWLIAALAAFTVHAYATLSAQVHENHIFTAVPLLVLASTGRPAFRPVCWAVSIIAALNLNLFYGFGDGVGYGFPRSLTVIDATVVLSIVNCAALCWHASVLRAQCSTAAAPLRSPAPA
jgi:hypothetical protein